MALTVEQNWQFAQRLERELQAKLKDREPLFEEIHHLLHDLRIACEDTIFLDFDYATEQKVETHLWDAHSFINNRYRKILARYKTEERRRHVVERRKWEQRYVDFLKTSQYFYKGYIQRLASHFDGLTELRKIAHRLQFNTLSVDNRVKVSGKTEHHILLSCYASLLRLGDLSRYRNDIRTKDRSWDMAMAYYGLANDLYPKSGNAFNQMAVISLAEGQHLNAIYHLYRALAIEEPHPVAEGNLAIEFKKITKEWASGSRVSLPKGAELACEVAGPLVSWFVRLHAKLYKGEEFSGHDELENEVLSQMTVLLKEQPLEGTLDKIVLINISAEYFAAERLQTSAEDGLPSEEQYRSYYSFLRLNVRMLFMLLQLLQPELAGPRDDDAPDVTGRESEIVESITAVTRRVLPALRQYSTWLVSRAEIISAQEDITPLSIHIKEMWSIYCSTLSLLVVAFPPENLTEVDYLLEEDAATVGLKPFRDCELCKLYTTDDGQLKPRTTDPNVERSHPNLEMRSRVRDLLRDAMVLAFNTNKDGKKIAPIHLVDLKFHFIEEGLPLSPMNGQSLDQAVPSPEVQHNANIPMITDSVHIQNDAIPRPASVAPSDSHQSMSTDMYRMVDELVTPTGGQRNKQPYGSDETSYGMHSLTAAEVFALSDLSARPVSRPKASPTLFPRLPGIYDSPFSPQPGELLATSPDRPGTAVRLSSMQLPSSQQQMTTAAALDQSTDYSHVQRLSWGNNLSASNSFPISTQQQSVNLQLQQSLAQQYKNPPSSAIFSNSSSLYLGTPMGRLNGGRPYGDISHSTSTTYTGASEFDLAAMIQSSTWNDSQSG